ncbi:patatin [Candidatus Poribacteria bacterium]|nr:MAG: patatin [Candidatus Poribacteria bacterium]
MSNDKVFRILSIDGGGIRGIIPATILKNIRKGTNKPLCQLFDLIAGTSTGGLLTLGLTKPNPYNKDTPDYTEDELFRFYKKDGKKIFDRSLLRKITSGDGWLDERYSSKGLKKVLRKRFGDTRLGDALTPVLITTYDMRGTRRINTADKESPYSKNPQRNKGGHPRFFKSYRSEGPTDTDYLMRDVAHATAAVPTYFEPHKIEYKARSKDKTVTRHQYETLIDGGIFANNPAMCAYAEARRYFPEQKDFLLVSIGTGDTFEEQKYKKAKDWGKLEWARPLISMILDGASDTVHYQLQQLLPKQGGTTQYYRFQPVLTTAYDSMDNADETNLNALKLIAKALIDERREDITEISDRLNSLEEQENMFKTVEDINNT